MGGNALDQDEEVDQDVREIIDSLKSKGLFDQFRKEFVADVDTKPSYQNLKQRVEGYVNRFLSRQTWSPDLNKNQLRDNLRRQINQSGMLTNGVERVIEQLVNPKILHIIKPKIDEVICKHLGIDPEKRKEHVEQSKQQHKEKMQNMQSLMNVNLTPPDNSNQGGATPGTPRTDFPPGFQGEGWSQQSPAPGQTGSNFSPGGMNFPMATPFSQQFGFSMPPQMFPYMQNSWNNYVFNQVGPNQTFTSPTTMQSGQETSSPAQNATPTLTSTESPPKPDLPPLPPSPRTPPPPGTEGEDIQIFPLNRKPEEKKILEEIPLPPPTKKSGDDDQEVSEDTAEIPSLDEIPLPPVCGDADDSLLDQGMKKYKFAWHENQEDAKSDVTVSSVHTSDLSISEDFTSESELEYSDLTDHGDDVEEEVASPDKLGENKQEGEVTEEKRERKGERVERIEDLMEEGKAVEAVETMLDKMEESIAHPDVHMEVHSDVVCEEVPKAGQNLPSSEQSSPPKRKLISLQYNLSDSEDEESREARKARVAKEKEERYMKRLQKRAELEAKRKEREEEKARLREERKKVKSKDMSSPTKKEDKGDSVSMESDNNLDEATNQYKIQSPVKKLPDSPEKKKRKTKAELKEELTKQKVMEKKAALHRQRTRNKRYTSEEFTSIFNEKSQPYSSANYSEVVMEEQVVEEVVTVESEIIMDVSSTEEEMPPLHVEEVHPPTSSQNLRSLTPEVAEIRSESGHADTKKRSQVKDSYRHGTSQRYSKSEENRQDSRRKRRDSESRPAGPPKASVKHADSMFRRPRSEDEKGLSTKRYNPSDLYKPRRNIARNRRRGSSPSQQTAEENADKITSAGEGKTSKEEKSAEAEEPPEVIEIESRSPSPVSSRSRSLSSSRSRSRSGSHSGLGAHSRLKSHRKKRRKRRSRSVSRSYSESRSRSPSKSRSRSYSRTRDGASPISSSSLSLSRSPSPSRHSSRSSYSRSRSKSRSRSVSRSSESSVDEFGRRKRKAGRTPLEEIDFGEAARMAKKSLVGVDFGEAERRSKQERGEPIANTSRAPEYPPFKIGEPIANTSRAPEYPPFKMTAMQFGAPPPPGAMSPVDPAFKKRMGKKRGYPPTRGVPRSNALRGNWFHQPWQYEEAAVEEEEMVMPPSPSRRFYPPDRSPLHYDDLDSLSPDSMGRHSPGMMRPPRHTASPSPPPYGIPRGIRGMSRSPSPPYHSHRHSQSMSPPLYAGRSIKYSRSPSPPPYIGRSMRPSRSPSPPYGGRPMRHSQSPSLSPPPYMGRRPRSPSPPYSRRPPSPYDESLPSPPMRGTRGHRPPSPPSPSYRSSPEGRIHTRSQRSQSPSYLSSHRGRPSTPLDEEAPSPPEYSPPPLSPTGSGYRSPSPLSLPRSPSPPHRPVTRGYHSPSNLPSPPPMRPVTPPTRPLTRGQRAVSPTSLPSPMTRRSQRPPSPPQTALSTRSLRAKHNAPQRYSPPPLQRMRPRPQSPPPAKKGKR
ncbi:serine/arginine repetitive matrix protein 2-like isoform X4 [Ostrea edulis]|uniref:serine/arginine repetitive matrix protein 2-like isoform X4 n=1 Tax=Ostrea edulis TaxID=37623 RepID=UPI0024AF2668|nr:serine/arginine repetitive matrix protein 2-like isoform X4 [Ostrea edulis]